MERFKISPAIIKTKAPVEKASKSQPLTIVEICEVRDKGAKLTIITGTKCVTLIRLPDATT